MAKLPRIITVDPVRSVPQEVRAAFELMDRLVVQIDVPAANDALAEIERAAVDVVIAAWKPGDNMLGWELAANIRKRNQMVPIIVVGEYGGQNPELEEQTTFVYLSRPYDVAQLVRVLDAALAGQDVFAAAEEPTSAKAITRDMGPVPEFNVARANDIVGALQRDLNSQAILFATRTGDVLVEHGAVGYLDRNEVTSKLTGGIHTHIDLREIIGGNASTLQFYDGDDTDLFVLSVGLHHFMVIIYDGTRGSRELGPVSRFGRRAAEDLIGVLGASAWIVQRPTLPEATAQEDVVRRSQVRPQPEVESAQIELAKAEISTPAEEEIEQTAEPQPTMEAIADDTFDPDALFGDDFDESAADDLFSLDALEDVQSDDSKSKGTIDWDDAVRIGLLDNE